MQSPPVPERVLVAVRDVPAGPGYEFDVLCTFGGTDFYDLPEEEQPPASTLAFEFVVRSGATTTGVQAGYERGDDITWLPIVRQEERTFRVDVDDPTGLDFKYQLNAVDDEACYTGASLGGYSIHVYALTV